jgi:hypothetical protein
MRIAGFFKRDLSLALAVSALVFLCALVWGKPFISSTGSAAVVVQTPAKSGQVSGQAGTGSFSGTILRHGEQFVLRDRAGQI